MTTESAELDAATRAVLDVMSGGTPRDAPERIDYDKRARPQAERYARAALSARAPDGGELTEDDLTLSISKAVSAFNSRDEEGDIYRSVARAVLALVSADRARLVAEKEAALHHGKAMIERLKKKLVNETERADGNFDFYQKEIARADAAEARLRDQPARVGEDDGHYTGDPRLAGRLPTPQPDAPSDRERYRQEIERVNRATDQEIERAGRSLTAKPPSDRERDKEPGLSDAEVTARARAEQSTAVFARVPDRERDREPGSERDKYEAWQRSRYVTAFSRNPKGTWGDETGEQYAAPFVQAGWEAWQAAVERAALTAHAPAPAVAVPEELSVAARDVLAERRRQVEVEGWTPEHDDTHDKGEMGSAAINYAAAAILTLRMGGRAFATEPPFSNWLGGVDWPWDREWWKPSTPRRDLVKAGALILAEIERLDRLAAPEARS